MEKYKRAKPKGNNKRVVVHLCPGCLSSLRFNSDGSYDCTGDRFDYWRSEFKKYDEMNQQQKLKYAEEFQDFDKFVDLYSRKEDLTCEHSGKIWKLGFAQKCEIPDPIQVKWLERQLNRKLTEEELHGEEPVFLNNKAVVVEKLQFPEDFDAI